MHVSRRDSFRLLLAGAAASGLPALASAAAGPQTLVLRNGFRAHLVPIESGYVSLSLILRSKEIVHQNGLAHLMEHTSFAGAAGSLTSQQVADAQGDYVQDKNASTALGVIQWDVSFLPRYLPQVLALLSDVTLDQKFDVETVKREAKIVLEELYLDKYNTSSRNQEEFDAALYGETHPHAKRTLEAEIATARLPPEELAAELRRFASTIRLPGNMDLFLVGDFEPDEVARSLEHTFGKYAHARGPYLDLPAVGVTRKYRAMSCVSPELTRPLCEIRIAWNTGVRVTDPDACTLYALCEHLQGVLFKQLREQHGDSYMPEVVYQPDACSGVIKIALPSSKEPKKIEKRVFAAIQSLKERLDEREARRFRDRAELRRRQKATSPDDLVECMVRKAIDGASVDEMRPEMVTSDQLLAAARQYLPSYKGAYVRMALKGQ